MEQNTTLEFGSDINHPCLGWIYIAAYTDCFCHKKTRCSQYCLGYGVLLVGLVFLSFFRWFTCGFHGGVARAGLCTHKGCLHSSLEETASPGTTEAIPVGLTQTQCCPSTALGLPGSVTFICLWAAPGPSHHQVTRVPVRPGAIWGCWFLVLNNIRTFHQGFQGKTWLKMGKCSLHGQIMEMVCLYVVREKGKVRYVRRYWFLHIDTKTSTQEEH